VRLTKGITAIGILSGDPDSSPSDVGSWDSDSSAEDDCGDTSLVEPPAQMKSNTAFEECLIDIAHFITCLYKFSIATQNPTPRDRLEKCSKIDMSHYEVFDIQHLAEKFPAAREHDYLIQRLGRANTKRRQLLKYYDQHHEKIAGHGDTAAEAHDQRDDASEANTANNASEANTATAATGMTRTDTTVSTYVPRGDFEAVDMDSIDTRSESGFSQSSDADSDFTQTSYASFTGGMGSLRVPDPPEGYDVHLQCPYCFTLMVVENRLSWMYAISKAHHRHSQWLTIVATAGMYSETFERINARLQTASVPSTSSPTVMNGSNTSELSIGVSGSVMLV